MNNTGNIYNEWKHEYRGAPSKPTLAIGFIVWFAYSVYCGYAIWQVYNAIDYLNVRSLQIMKKQEYK
jgi:hypothetical protein